MTRYYCSGYDTNPGQAFAHGLGEMLKNELKDTKSIIYIPAGEGKVEKLALKYIPSFEASFKNVGINFDNIEEIEIDKTLDEEKKQKLLLKSRKSRIISPEMDREHAIELINNASMIMITGGDPYLLKSMCEKMGIMDALKNYKGVMMGYSAGAMLMSKHIIITPCSEEYPDFHIEDGLNLDGISIFPHNNTSSEEYPDVLDIGGEVYRKEDNIKVAQEYGEYYLLQDQTDDGIIYNISLIKSTNGNLEYYTENNGKIWVANSDSINLFVPELSKTIKR